MEGVLVVALGDDYDDIRVVDLAVVVAWALLAGDLFAELPPMVGE